MTAFLKDAAQIAADNFRAGRIDRRTALKVAAMAGVAPAALGPAGRARAADEIVVANWAAMPWMPMPTAGVSRSP